MGQIGWTILLICLLSAGTLFFSVNAIALRIFSLVKLQEAFREANRTKEPEELASGLIQSGERLILACSVYRVVFNLCIFLLLLVCLSAARPAGSQISNYLLAVIVALPIFLIFSLAIPHAWAKYAGEKILSRTYKLLMFFSVPVWPVVYVLQLYDVFVKRLVGVAESTPGEDREEKQEEFLTGLEQHRMEGAVDEEEQEMIENVLELSETTAGEIMTPRTDIVAVEVSSDRQMVLDIITGAGHSRVPVYEDNIDNIIGLIYAKDLLADVGRGSGDFKLRDKMRGAYFVPETKPIRTLLHEFQNQKLHIAVLLDEYGGTAGIVTLEDILEELVGEITDEYEKPVPGPIKRIDEETIEVDARTYIDDLNEEFELSLPEDEDYDTVGGFVFSHLGYVPKTGEAFDYENLNFTISFAEARRIKRLRIRKTVEQ